MPVTRREVGSVGRYKLASPVMLKLGDPCTGLVQPRKTEHQFWDIWTCQGWEYEELFMILFPSVKQDPGTPLSQKSHIK